MKRREFLSASLGLAGALAPPFARSESKPCPPPTVSVSGGGTTETECGTPPQGGTSLRDAANALEVGQWAPFKTADWPGGTLAFWETAGSSDGILDFLHVGVHDAARGRIHILGAGYGNTGHVVYDETKNAWTSSAMSLYNVHVWDHVAYDQQNGVVYFGSQGGGGQYSTTAASPGTFTNQPAPWSAFNDTYGMEFWPSVGLVIVNRNGEVYRRPIGGSWARVSGGGPALSYHMFLTYNPVLNCMYFGGGSGTSTVFRKLSFDGSNWSISALPNSPGVDCVRQKLTCTDRNGHAVSLDHANGAVHRYIDGGSWTRVATSFPADLISTAARTAAVPLRGFTDREVIMSFWSNADDPSEVLCYLYRYS